VGPPVTVMLGTVASELNLRSFPITTLPATTAPFITSPLPGRNSERGAYSVAFSPAGTGEVASGDRVGYLRKS